MSTTCAALVVDAPAVLAEWRARTHASVVVLGVIGGTGLESIAASLDSPIELTVLSTPFGRPSGPLRCGTLRQAQSAAAADAASSAASVSGSGTSHSVRVCLLSRHGPDHSYQPSNVPYRANLYALRALGVTHLVAATACGSLRIDYKPGDFVLLDQLIDRTTRRTQTFYDGSCGEFVGICHMSMGWPFDEPLRRAVLASARESGMTGVHEKGTVVTIEGPRFSTYAESKLFQSWGCDIVNMTCVPEVVLAREIGIAYVSVALVTDYDCWHAEEVSIDAVTKMMRANAVKFIDLLHALPAHVAELKPIRSARELGAVM